MMRAGLLPAALDVFGVGASFFLILICSPSKPFAQSQLPPCSSDLPQSSWDNCQGEIPANGNKYVGEFRGGKFDGQGVLTNSARGYKYVGGFIDGKPNGQGIATTASGDQLVGDFKDGKLQGLGTYTDDNGNKYSGEFKDSKPDGHGSMKYANGKRYVGEYRNGKRSGLGTSTFVDGSKFVGEYRDDKRSGQGSYFAADGAIISSGKWVDGRLSNESALAGQETIAMEESGGVWVVPVRFNNAITLNSVVDSGATDVSVPADIVSTLMRTKTVTEQDFLGKQTYVLADGSKVPSQRFRIKSLKIGNKTVENVIASIASVNGEILLGQRRKFRSWSVDNEQHALILR